MRPMNELYSDVELQSIEVYGLPPELPDWAIQPTLNIIPFAQLDKAIAYIQSQHPPLPTAVYELLPQVNQPGPRIKLYGLLNQPACSFLHNVLAS